MKTNLNIRTTFSRLAVFPFLLLIGLNVYAQSSLPNPDWGMVGTNSYFAGSSRVNALIKDPNSSTLYIGGNFDGIYKPVAKGASINKNTGAVDPGYAAPNNSVNAVVPDGNGGWYIGGVFTTVGGQPRNRLAHIDANGQPTSWNPDANNNVLCLVKTGNTIFVGGQFTSIGGQSRWGIAAIDATTGSPMSWNPSPSYPFASWDVRAMTLSGSILYIGGNFETISGQSRNRLAAIDINTGSVTSWNPGVSGGQQFVSALAKVGNLIYVGGSFTAAGGQSRNNIVAVDASTGLATSWNPNVNGSGVYSIAASASTVYLAGSFTSVAGQSRNNIAAVDASSGSVSSWNPNANGQVGALKLINSTLYVGGDFKQIGGQTRFRLAVLDTATGLATSWTNHCAADYGASSGVVMSIASYGAKLYIGGSFNGAGGILRNNLAAVNTATGEVTSFNPGANNEVASMELKNGLLYVGGGFTTINGQSRNRLAAIDLSNGSVTTWNPNVGGGRVLTLAVGGNSVYLGGDFNAVGGQGRSRIAEVSLTTGSVTSWNPNSNDIIYSLALSNNTIYVGGDYTTIGGQSRNRIAAIDASTGLATPWNPNALGPVYALLVAGNTVYAGGGFGFINGQLHPRLAAVNINSGLISSWDANVDGVVDALAMNGGTLYVGGNIQSIGGQTRYGAAALDTATAMASSWNPNVEQGTYVYAIAAGSGSAFIGGDFSTVGGQNRRGLAAFIDPCTSAPFKPGAVTQSGGATKVCPGESRTYTVASDTNVIGYNWSVPTGASIVSGQGTNEVVISFDGSFAASDTISVRGENSCGNSAYRTKVVSRGATPSTPPAITGENYGACTASGVAYSVTNTPDVTYAWSFSNVNGTVASGQGTNAITADFTPGATTTVLSVTATNGCGTSTARTKTIYAKPGTPVSVSGSAAVCANDMGVAYSTPAIFGASTYTWKAPAGSHVSDGVTTSTGASLTTASNAVTVNFGATAGNVQVRANNTCGSSGYFFKPVTMNCRMSNGVEEAIASEDLTLYPNPATDQVTVSFQAERVGEYTINLYDVIGKQVLTTTGITTTGKNQLDLNTAELASGVYHIVLKGQGLDYNTKLILDK